MARPSYLFVCYARGKVKPMKFSKRIPLIAILIPCLIFMSACNVDATVTLVGQLAVNLLNSCAALSIGAADQAACSTASAAIQVLTSEIVVTHDAYVANKTAGTLAALKSAIAAAIVKVPQILAALHISNSNTLNIVTVAINLIVSTIQIIAAAFGVVSTTPTATLRASNPNVKSNKDIKNLWNQQVCGSLTGSALAGCVVN